MRRRQELIKESGELLSKFLDNPELKRQKGLFRPRLGNPIWWVASYDTAGRARGMRLVPKCSTLWLDTRLDHLSCREALFDLILTRHARDQEPFTLQCPAHRLTCYCIPLIVDGKRIGMFGLSHLKTGTNGLATLGFLHALIRTLLECADKDVELRRLTESIRPRAIALSTVHTVHRVINSTLNMDELLTRLTHLTSQVVRAKTCTIYLQDPSGESTLLVERAKAGFDKKRAKILRSVKPGEGIEGKVFEKAIVILRKNVISVPLIDEDVIGVMTLTQKKDPKGFDEFDREILTTLAEEAVIAIKNAALYEEQRRVTLSTIQSLANILGTKLEYTSKMDVKYLLEITLAMADALKLSDEDRLAIHYATLLKDAGKIGLPDDLLRKPEKLTGYEYQLVRQHPVKGARILQSFESLRPVVPIILHSHEKYDGSGYPDGLKRDEIPLGSRILAVVNAFEALIAGRPYRTKASLEDALAELHRNTGTQFDPRVMEAFDIALKKLNIQAKMPHA